jgi:hypothetical protein
MHKFKHHHNKLAEAHKRLRKELARLRHVRRRLVDRAMKAESRLNSILNRRADGFHHLDMLDVDGDDNDSSEMEDEEVMVQVTKEDHDREFQKKLDTAFTDAIAKALPMLLPPSLDRALAEHFAKKQTADAQQ